MTMLGKAFTVAILIMSTVFMAFSIMVYATHTNWKRVADNPNPQGGEELGLKQKYENMVELKRQLEATRDKLLSTIAVEQAARRNALASLQARLTIAEDELGKRERILQQLTATETKTAGDLEVAQNLLSDLTGEVKGLRDEIRVAQGDVLDKYGKLVALTDEVNEARRVTRDLEGRLAPLQRTRAGLLDVAKRAGRDLKIDIAADGTVTSNVDHLPPDVDGIVVDVNSGDLIEISIGEDDGLLIGHQLDVYRRGAYLGRVVVVKTAADRAVAEVIPDYRKGPIKKGDKVDTKLT